MTGNVLLLMVDQMRADCLSCLGHPTVQTPHLDALAARGVTFTNCFVQSAVCGPSRACFYTGRYVHTHRSTWNSVPLPLDEQTVGDLFTAAGYRAALCGKTHYMPDFLICPGPGDANECTGPPRPPGPFGSLLERAPARTAPLRGLEPWEFDDGRGAGWLAFLRTQGYDDGVLADPFVVQTPGGERISGWDFRSAPYPTVVRAEHSDTAYLTDRALAFLHTVAATPDQPWFLHLSYFKPHWPNVAPAPYHARYRPEDVPPPNRDPSELADPHPLLEPFRRERRALPLDQEPVWRQMRATYYGLVAELDHHIGRVWDALEKLGLREQTLVICTADHGEYLGDHWMFEKELFYDEAYRVPLIVYDPRPAAETTRGRMQDAFVQAIDVLPTMLEWAGLPVPAAVQGRSFLPLVHGSQPPDWPLAVYADWDFRFYWTPKQLGVPPRLCRGWMVRDRRYKYWHFAASALPDVLFDLEADPCERRNVAADPAYSRVVNTYRTHLLDWRMSNEDERRVAWAYARRPSFGRNPFTDS